MNVIIKKCYSLINSSKMNIVYFYFFNIVTLTAANDCECEVESWGEWGSCSATCAGRKVRTRICSTKMGLTLGLTCHEKDETIKYEFVSCNTKPCRELFNVIKPKKLRI